MAGAPVCARGCRAVSALVKPRGFRWSRRARGGAAVPAVPAVPQLCGRSGGSGGSGGPSRTARTHRRQLGPSGGVVPVVRAGLPGRAGASHAPF